MSLPLESPDHKKDQKGYHFCILLFRCRYKYNDLNCKTIFAIKELKFCADSSNFIHHTVLWRKNKKIIALLRLCVLNILQKTHYLDATVFIS